MDFSFWRLLISSCSFLISSPCRVMSSMDFTKLLEESKVVTGMTEGICTIGDVDIVLTHVIGTACKEMTIIGTLCYFSFTIVSSSASISLICAFFSMISFIISSFWPLVSANSFSYGSFVAGIFSCFLKDAMSVFFFFSISSTSLTFDGSYPILSTISSRDLILLSSSREDIFSSFNRD
jgi:hypothetical protein